MQCCEQFSPEYVTSARETCAELTCSELDMAILGQLAPATNTSSTCLLECYLLKEPIMRRQNVKGGIPAIFKVCQKMFRFFHGIGKKRLKNLAASFRVNRKRPHTHGNAKKLPHNTISFTSLQYFVHYFQLRGAACPSSPRKTSRL